MREVCDESVPPLELPQIDDLGPAPGRTHRSPDTEARHVAFLTRRRAPVRGHVLHVAGAVRPDDVDQFVDVDLVVHQGEVLTSATASPNAATVSQNAVTPGAGRGNASPV